MAEDKEETKAESNFKVFDEWFDAIKKRLFKFIFILAALFIVIFVPLQCSLRLKDGEPLFQAFVGAFTEVRGAVQTVAPELHFEEQEQPIDNAHESYDIEKEVTYEK